MGNRVAATFPQTAISHLNRDAPRYFLHLAQMLDSRGAPCKLLAMKFFLTAFLCLSVHCLRDQKNVASLMLVHVTQLTQYLEGFK